MPSDTTPSDIAAGLGQVPDGMGNGITRISSKGTSVTECDLEAQLEGHDNLSVKYAFSLS